MANAPRGFDSCQENASESTDAAAGADGAEWVVDAPGIPTAAVRAPGSRTSGRDVGGKLRRAHQRSRHRPGPGRSWAPLTGRNSRHGRARFGGGGSTALAAAIFAGFIASKRSAFRLV